MNPFNYFWLFLKASLFSTGGLGNLPFLQKDLTALGSAKNTDFVTAIAVGQISPGPTGLWSISLGYLTFGWWGAGLALIALSLPPLLALAVSAIHLRVEKLQAVQDLSRGLGLGVVGLTLAIACGLAGLTGLSYEQFEAEMETVINNPARNYEVQVREIYSLGVFLANKKYRYLRLAYLSFITGLFASFFTLLGTGSR